MKQNKEASLGWIVATYWATVAIIGLLGAVLWGLVLYPYVIPGEWSITLVTYMNYLWNFLFLFGGIWYAARYVTQRYRIENPSSVIKWSTVVYTILTLFSIGYLLVYPLTDSIALIVEDIILYVLYAVFFYFMTKKYITKGTKA